MRYNALVPVSCSVDSTALEAATAHAQRAIWLVHDAASSAMYVAVLICITCSNDHVHSLGCVLTTSRQYISAMQYLQADSHECVSKARGDALFGLRKVHSGNACEHFHSRFCSLKQRLCSTRSHAQKSHRSLQPSAALSSMN